MTTHRYRIPLYVAGGILLFALLALLFGLLVQFLWNEIMVAVFDLPAVSYWQALGIYILAKLFFGFMPGGDGGSRGRTKRAGAQRGDQGTPGMPPQDESFRQYWQEEGRQAFDDYLAAKRHQRESPPSEGA